MNDVVLRAPCGVRELPGAWIAEDADGRAIAYVYFAEGARKGSIPGSWSKEEARVLAQRIARGFTLSLAK